MNAVIKDLSRAASLTVVPAVRLLRGDAVALEPVNWLWPGFLPAGMLTILGGAPGCGKTTIALSLAATITTAGDWPDGTRCHEPGDVLLWSGEDPPSVTAARLSASGADMRRVHFIAGITGGEGEAFDPALHIDLLEAAAEKLPAPRLLVIDPIVSAVSGDGHKSNDVRRALQPVVDLAQRLGCAVVGITHFSKGTSGRDPVERITGSLAFAALARVVLVAAKVRATDDSPGPKRVLVRAKSNIGPDDGGFSYALGRVIVAPGVEGQRVLWLEALDGSAREVLAEADAESDGDDEASALDDAEAFLRTELRDGPKSAKSLYKEARDAGHSDRTLKRAKAVLQVESTKEKAGWVWSIPINGAKVAKGTRGARAESAGLIEIPGKEASPPSRNDLGLLDPLGTLDDDSEVF